MEGGGGKERRIKSKENERMKERRGQEEERLEIRRDWGIERGRNLREYVEREEEEEIEEGI